MLSSSEVENTKLLRILKYVKNEAYINMLVTK
jgi:hypothetical protein